jgi:DNA polymerase III subunit alpha
MAEFVHLHVHTQYSFLDSAVRIGTLAKTAKDMGMKAVAITDHGNMFGALQFYKACRAHEVVPILGCEVNVARREEGRERHRTPVDHLVLLAKNERGYKNLLKIVSLGQTEPASDLAPSVVFSTVAENSAGLVCLTGCLGGVVAQQVLDHGQDAAIPALAEVRDAFEPGALFVEIQDHGFIEDPVVGKILVDAAKKLDLPIAATNDVHYMAKEDAEAQLYLACVQSGRTYDEAKTTHHGSSEMYFKSADEMARRLRAIPHALENTLLVAEMCSGLRLDLGRPMLPDFAVPQGFDAPGYFAHVAREGLRQRLAELASMNRAIDRGVYEKRLETEIQVIIKMGFSGYFLIVWDFIRHAKNRGVPVGPGRGSGAGSLVAYSMRITDLDPIPYNLLFERFLNPERISMPDFDIDFCKDRRDEVIAYVTEKYGRESVGQIATFHELKARSVIKDVGRAMGVAANDAQALANLIPANPEVPGQMLTISKALEAEPKLAEKVTKDAVARDLVRVAQKLEGLVRHAGKHAAGVVISSGPLWDHVPCFLNEGKIVTQYDKDDVEEAGLVKFDFLGLKTLTVIAIATRLVNARPDRGEGRFDVADLPLDDKLTYQLLQSGETTGVFQLESTGMQQLFKDYRPEVFEDIIALGALYRPGPLKANMVSDFVDRKHGRSQVASLHTLVDDVVKPTRGVIVYQEQVMLIAQKLAGYTLGAADVLRKAMGKKDAEKMAKQEAAFVQGARDNGVGAADAKRIFGLIEKFAGYGFNKSHAAAYGLLTYQTAYLKAHYPVEFLCALLTADHGKIEKVVRIIAEGRAMGATVLPPDINHSHTDFTVVYASPGGDFTPGRGSKIKDPYQPQIRFGLGAVRGIGEAALDAVFEARSVGGPFHDLFDFAGRVDARRVNKATLQSLIQCGAFDSTLAAKDVSRARAYAAVDLALERSRSASKDRERGQATLFTMLGADRGSGAAKEGGLDQYPPCEPWDLRQTLRCEKKALGFYVSGHPLGRYGKELRRFDVISTVQLSGQSQWAKVRVAGVIENYREKTFSNSKRAFFELEDEVGRVDVKVTEKKVEAFSEILADLVAKGEPALVEGKVSFPMTMDDEPDDIEGGDRKATLLFDSVKPLADAVQSETRGVSIRISASRTEPAQLLALKDLLAASPGECLVNVVIDLGEGQQAVLSLGQTLKVAPSDAMLAGLERLFGQNVAELR